MIEYWDENANRYRQEYYQNIQTAANRFADIRNDIPNSEPEMSTFIAD
jgi:hypothetical protein